MKIIFCSNYHGQTATTTNLFAAAVLTDILYDKKSLILQTQVDKNYNNLPIIEYKRKNRVLRMEKGTDKLLCSYVKNQSDKNLFGGYGFSVPDSSISLIPCSSTEDENYVEALAESLGGLLSIAEELYEIIFIDAGVIPDKLTKVMYQEADLIVVCLSQNKQVLDDFFYYGQKNEKMLYIISSYDKYSVFTKEHLFGNFQELNRNNTFFLPYNIAIKDSVSKSSLLSFFYTNIGCEKTESNYEFVQSALKLTRYINQSM